MATFLTTPKMSPALRARVERAVSHRVRAKGNQAALGGAPFESGFRFPIARILPIAALALVVAVAVSIQRGARRELESERAAVLASLASRRAELPPGHEGFLGATDRWIAEAATEAALPDVVEPGLRRAGLDALLHRPAVYLHAASSELRDAKKLDEALGASIKDSFLWCLLTAPKTTESELLARVKGTYFGGAKLDEETANVRRLADARMGLEVLGPAFEEVVRKARDLATLKRLKRVLDAAPTAQAKVAAGAEVLIVVTDVKTEDGRRDPRVVVVDLASQKLLLRVRPRVDESKVAVKGGAHGEQLQGCGLALAVRSSVD